VYSCHLQAGNAKKVTCRFYDPAAAKRTLSGRLVPVSGVSGTGWHATGKVLGSQAIEWVTLTSAKRGHVGTYVISLTYRGVDSDTMRQAVWIGHN
jgi:hypothetical protein